MDRALLACRLCLMNAAGGRLMAPRSVGDIIALAKTSCRRLPDSDGCDLGKYGWDFAGDVAPPMQMAIHSDVNAY